jgi:hypothetical protein
MSFRQWNRYFSIDPPPYVQVKLTAGDEAILEQQGQLTRNPDRTVTWRVAGPALRNPALEQRDINGLSLHVRHARNPRQDRDDSSQNTQNSNDRNGNHGTGSSGYGANTSHSLWARQASPRTCLLRTVATVAPAAPPRPMAAATWRRPGRRRRLRMGNRLLLRIGRRLIRRNGRRHLHLFCRIVRLPRALRANRQSSPRVAMRHTSARLHHLGSQN